MKIKIFYPNRDGNIEFSKKDLELLLEEAYDEGYRDGRASNVWTTSTPSITFGSQEITTGDFPKWNSYTISSDAINTVSTEEAPITIKIGNN